MACREILLTLYRMGLIDYPPGVHDGNNKKRNQSIPFIPINKSPLNTKLSDLEPVELKLVRNTDLEKLYNSLVQEHHYLGFRQIVGLRPLGEGLPSDCKPTGRNLPRRARRNILIRAYPLASLRAGGIQTGHTKGL